MNCLSRFSFGIAMVSLSLSAYSRAVPSLLVMYTDDARAAAGGTVNVQNQIVAALADGRLSLGNSVTNMDIHLVAMTEIAVTETNYANLTTLNTDLSNPAHSVFGVVHRIRDQVSADLVFLLVEGIQANGQALQVCGSGLTCDRTFAPFAFSSGQRGVMLASPAMLIHELGHVMGLRHDRTRDCLTENTTCLTAAFPYSYGRIDPSSPPTWGTVMAGGRPFPLINFFSNPSLTHPTTGQVLGIANVSDAARSLRNVGEIAASWRVPLVSPLSPLVLQ